MICFLLGFTLGYRRAEIFYKKIADIWRKAYYENLKQNDNE